MNAPTPSREPGWPLLPFADFLVRREFLSKAALEQVARFRSAVDLRLGHLAALKGYLSAKDICYVLASQVESGDGKRFGEVAIRRGILSEQQLREIVKLQSDPFELFQECLVLCAVVSREDLAELLKQFSAAAGIPLATTPDEMPAPAPPSSTRIVRIGQDRVLNTLRRLETIAAPSETILSALESLSNPDVRLQEISTMIESEATLAAQVLKLVNSAFFGVRGKIKNVPMAIVALGINGIRRMLIMLSALQPLIRGNRGRSRQYRRHAVQSAAWAQMLARHRTDLDPADAFLAGLIHELGEYVVDQAFPDDRVQIEQKVEGGGDRLEAERSFIGATHADLGAYLSDHWSYPAHLTQAIFFHHTPAIMLRVHRDLLPVTTAVNGACVLADLPFETRAAEAVSHLDDDFLSVHHVQREEILKMFEEIRRVTDEHMTFFGESS